MIDIGSLEGWLRRANTAGWDWFAEQPGADPERAQKAKERQQLQNQRLASIWADFARTPDGAEALQALVDQTLNRTLVPSVAHGLTLEQTALYAQFREGQNNIVQAVLALAAMGGNPEAQPKPRDVS